MEAILHIDEKDNLVTCLRDVKRAKPSKLRVKKSQRMQIYLSFIKWPQWI